MTDATVLPGTPDVAHLGADFLIVAPFVRYEEVAGTTLGRIIMAGRQPLGGTKLRQGKGDLILPIDANMTTDYLDLSGAEPAVMARPALASTFDTLTPAVRQEATMKDVAPCVVSFSGPLSGQQQHPGGDLSIGFTLPGTYTIALEAFPALPVTFTMTVAPGAAS